MNTTYEAQRTAAEKIEDEALKSRVLRGLELLKKEYGEDWVKHINPQTLDLSSGHRCVLGQLEDATQSYGGNYETAIERIDGDLEYKGGTHFGFDSGYDDSNDDDADDENFEYDDLTDAWLIVIGAE